MQVLYSRPEKQFWSLTRLYVDTESTKSKRTVIPGGYSQLTAFIRDWRGKEGKAPHAFVPLKFDLGEAFQFDWSEEGLVIGGIYRRMQVSHLKLCAIGP